MDAAWGELTDAWSEPVLGAAGDQLSTFEGRYDTPPGGQYGGWHIWMEKDLRTVLGDEVEGKFGARYCGGGDLAECRASLWSALRAAGDEVAATQGADPTTWRASATAERIRFVPGVLPYTMAYANRPSGIQQIISFDGHRPRR